MSAVGSARQQVNCPTRGVDQNLSTGVFQNAPQKGFIKRSCSNVVTVNIKLARKLSLMHITARFIIKGNITCVSTVDIPLLTRVDSHNGGSWERRPVEM